MHRRFRLSDVAASITEPNGREIMASFGPYHVMAVSCEGEFPFHEDDKDEFFLVLQGEIEIDFDDGTERLTPGDAIFISRRTRHNTRAQKRALIMMIDTDEQYMEGQLFKTNPS